MAFDPIALAVKGGIHSEALLRMVAYRDGGEGVTAAGALSVKQQSVASGNVDIATGGAILVNRYPGVVAESYVGRASSLTSVAIAPNAGGATRYDLLIARIDDWNFPGSQAVPGALPTSTVPVFKPVVLSGVAATATARSLGLAYPAIDLARIAIPAGTSAITQAMITDLRQLANPRRLRSLLTKAIVTGQESNLDTTAGAGKKWPATTAFTTDIPEWATRARIIWGVKGARIASGQAYGPTWTKVGVGDASMVATQTVYWDTGNANNVVRLDIGGSDDIYIPVGLRGKKSAVIEIWGSVAAGSASTAYPRADASSSVAIDIEFLEAPAQDA